MLQSVLLDDSQASRVVPLLHPAGPRDDAAVTSTPEDGCLEHQAMYGLPAARTGTHWLLTTALMMSDMFGLGALSLPADFARMGWLPALICMTWFSITDVYAGYIYQRLAVKLPQTVVFDEFGAAALGQCGKVLVYTTVYLTILCQPVMFQLMCMEALQQSLYMYNLSWKATCFIIAGLMLPLAQISNIEEVAWVSIMGSAGMLVAMVIVCGKLVFLYLDRQAPAPTQLVSNQGFEAAVIGLMDIAFAFGGQQNWMRWISTMKHRNRFAAAVSITTALMSVVYLMTAVTGYAALGTDVDMQRPISSVIGQDTWTLVMNAGILVHCIIAYQVNINVWVSTLLRLIVVRRSPSLTKSTFGYSSSVWLLVTVLCISISAWLAYSLPFFSIIMAVVASLGDFMSMFGLPCLFAISLLQMPQCEVGLCSLMVVAASVASGVGVVSSLRQLAQAYHQDQD